MSDEYEYPITVTNIAAAEAEKAPPIKQPLFRGKPGDFVAVRPCGDECKGKTYLGILVGDVALSFYPLFDKTTGTLTIERGMYNPCLLVPSLQRVVYGVESWWGLITSPDDLRKITDQDIDSVWYVQALKRLTENADVLEEEEAS